MTFRRAVMRTQSVDVDPDTRQVTMICSTEMIGRDKLILVSRGIDLTNYRHNPIWLFNHDPDSPIARSVDIGVDGQERLKAVVQFPPEGVSAKADEVYGLLRSKILNAASTGFDDLEAEPIDPTNTRAGWRITRSELLEMSIVSIPAVPNALAARSLNHLPNGEILGWLAKEVGDAAVEAFRRRAMGWDPAWNCCGAGDLEVIDGDYDAAAAAERIFAAAGFDGEKPDIEMAKRAFGVYNANAPLLKRSYGLPFGDIADGKVVAVRMGLEAVNAKLDQAEIPDTAKACVRGILAQYGVGEEPATEENRGAMSTIKRNIIKRGLYEVGELAYLVQLLGWLKDSAEWEAEMEHDASTMPAKLGEALKLLGTALIDMTAEEVAELLGEENTEVVTTGLTDGEATIVQQSKSPALARFRVGAYRARATAALPTTRAQRSPARQRLYRRRLAALIGAS